MTPAHLQARAVPDDSTDDKILACAVEGQVDYVVSSDDHLVDLRSSEGISIVTPRRFLELLTS